MQNFKKRHSDFISRQSKLGQAEKVRKKNFVPNIVSTRFGLDHSQKNSKKIQKIRKGHFGFISSQVGQGHAEKEKKNFVSSTVSPDPS